MTDNCTSSLECQANLPSISVAEMCGTSTFVLFLSLLDQLIRSNNKISGACERIKSIEKPNKKYDYVVIGGGAAGAVVAERMSKDGNSSVLVIEDGGLEPAIGQVPLFALTSLGTDVDWTYRTTNEKNACLADKGSCTIAAGRMLGGSTGHNAMTYMRGTPSDYDHWAALGNEGWSWKDVKPFFLRAEDNGEIERVGRVYHSTGGPLHVERCSHVIPFEYSILNASLELGYGVTEDPNGEHITGFSIAQTTSKNGVRRSSARTYLWPARNRKNLHVSLKSLATKVIIKNKKAVGVEYYQNGKLKRVHVKREVILSAGAIRSPQLLLLSGIGPKKDLESVGIKMVKDLPGVGKNFHDHTVFPVEFTIDEPNEYDNSWKDTAQYLVDQTGSLSCLALPSVVALMSTNASTPDKPNIQLYWSGYGTGCAPGQPGALISDGPRPVSLRCVNLHPIGRGCVSLNSSDPHQYPKIYGNYLGESKDVETMLDAIDLATAMPNTKAMRARKLTLSHKPLEACSKHPYPSRKYWACALRQSQVSDFHPAGSCKMGPRSDPMAVVDARLRVYGIKGLRVADTSIMPEITSGNTGVPAMMIGDRAADFMIEDLAQKSDEKKSCSRGN